MDTCVQVPSQKTGTPKHARPDANALRIHLLSWACQSAFKLCAGHTHAEQKCLWWNPRIRLESTSFIADVIKPTVDTDLFTAFSQPPRTALSPMNMHEPIRFQRMPWQRHASEPVGHPKQHVYRAQMRTVVRAGQKCSTHWQCHHVSHV